jgi:hypothetical protein
MQRQTVKTEDLEVFEIGERLAKHAQEREISARGRITELFPYIYQASKRMSTRAISEFLADNFGLKLSAVGVSRALKEEEKHWQKLAEILEPSAMIVARAHGVEASAVLDDEEKFLALASRPPKLSRKEGHGEYEEAVGFLKRRWYTLDEESRQNCWPYLAGEEDAK